MNIKKTIIPKAIMPARDIVSKVPTVKISPKIANNILRNHVLFFLKNTIVKGRIPTRTIAHTLGSVSVLAARSITPEKIIVVKLKLREN